MKTKETVHNRLEAEVLIKESFSHGNEDMYNDTKFYTHSGDFLFNLKIHLTEYEMIFSDNSSITVEV